MNAGMTELHVPPPPHTAPLHGGVAVASGNLVECVLQAFFCIQPCELLWLVQDKLFIRNECLHNMGSAGLSIGQARGAVEKEIQEQIGESKYEKVNSAGCVRKIVDSLRL